MSIQFHISRMFQTIIVSSLCCLLAVSGCADGSVGSRSLLAQPSPVVQEVPSDTVITLERTICYGPCPIYKLAIYADGRVLFEGEEHVKEKGRVESSISLNKVRELIAAFEQLNYFDLKDSYSGRECPEMWTDDPSAITSLTINGKTKTVKHYYGCRGLEVLKELKKLEGKIDEAVNVNQWVKGS